jgi:PAS domain S-box-containing protein
MRPSTVPGRKDSLEFIAARVLTSLALAVGGLVCVSWLLTQAFSTPGGLAGWRGITGATLFAFGGLSWLLMRSGHDRAAGAAALLSVQLAAGVHAVGSGLGVHTLAMTSSALAMAVSGLLLSARLTLGLATVYVATIVGLYAAERAGLLPGQALSGAVVAEERPITHAVLIVAGLIVALLVGRLLRATLERLRAGERSASALLRIGSDWTWQSDVKGRIVAVSDEFERFSGLAHAEALALGLPRGPMPIRDAGFQRMREHMHRGAPYIDLPIGFVLADGNEFWVRSSASPLRDGDGAVCGWQGTSRNITAERAAEREHQRTEGMLEQARLQADAIVDSAAVGIALVRQHRFERVNPQWEAIFDRPRGSLIGQSIAPLFPDHGAFLAFTARADSTLRAGTAIDVERDFLHLDGRRLRLRLRARALDRTRLDELGALWLAEDVTERRATESALAQAKLEAEAASRAKSAFLATMSHEIRTPLNGVLGLARMLHEDTLPAAQRRELLDHLLDSAQSLAGIVSDVLDLSKIEAGHLEIEAVAFDLHELVASSFRTYDTLGRERGLAMRCVLADSVPRRVRGDPLRVRQIVTNYLGNALKFTQAGRVELAVSSPAPGRLRIAVNDTGPGVPLALQRLLFKPFVQADGSTTRRYGGTGLGLSIVRELAERMGGSVGMQSDGVQGSSFWAEIELPALPADEAGAIAVAFAGAVVGSGAGPGANAGATSPPPAGAGAEAAPAAASTALVAVPPAPPPLHGRVLLVAEDNPVNLLIVAAMLQGLGARVLEATDGEQAVVLGRRHAHELDAVLMDLHMPVQDGLAATRALRADPLTTVLPVLALSAAVLDSEREAARAAGMLGFIAKPVHEAELLRALQAAGL